MWLSLPASDKRSDYSRAGLLQGQLQSVAAGVGGGVFDEGAAKVRSALAGLPDGAWQQNWKLLFAGKTIFDGTRFLAYRQMFLRIPGCSTKSELFSRFPQLRVNSAASDNADNLEVMELPDHFDFTGFDPDCETCQELCAELVSVNGTCPPALRERAVASGVERLTEHIPRQHASRQNDL
jgi:hypothetical protein